MGLPEAQKAQGKAQGFNVGLFFQNLPRSTGIPDWLETLEPSSM